ncbi:Ionotropic glutamate receptor, L-glutamate and glycine-binding domain,Ionotropic glutamate receptor [Cinara cedri]|uniref:Ionotropic glutamate receptor, L-glutamate and glycine-binding domain,Ionotropic glutamate receptor n=1 Tax=Cinara cedri TaxID=506608 RepID=A0A5E4MI42_9HEMI|nr:Ionotropic glutamate receptor, L-glutamate and glycine-binding domain,Ionotropic glutamate receptor [Cinara cedri]
MNICTILKLVKFFIICKQIWATENINVLKEIKSESEFENLAVDLTYKWIDTATCLNLILDQYHNNLLDKSFYHSFIGIPFFKIFVNDSEDLLSPKFQMWQILNQVRKQGCNMNIIFILNADQTIRLLKFSDKHRMLNLNSKFVLLHDRRLFIKEHHTLWTKIINVVFIRKYRLKEIYELSTVPYPTPIKGVLVTLRLDLWSKRKFQKQTDLYRNKVSDLQGNSLKVVTFNFIPSAIKSALTNDENSGYNKGLEIEVLKSLGNAMNFIPVIYEPMNWRTEQWGRKQMNGTLSGLLGEMWSARADLALGNLHYTPYHLNILDLSIPYNTECLTFLTFESKTDNSWKTLILPFKLNMWVGVLITLLIGGFLFYALATAHKHIDDDENTIETISDTKELEINKNMTAKNIFNILKNKFKKPKILEDKKLFISYTGNNKLDQLTNKDVVGLYLFEHIGNSILYTYGMLIAVSLPKVPTGWAIRILTGWWWIYCLLVAVAYKASMTAILANPDTRITIDTVEALVDSNVDCGGWGEQSKEFFMTSLDKIGQRVGQKFEEVYNVDEAIDRVSKGQFAYYDNIYFLKYVKVMQKNKTYGQDIQLINGTMNGTSNGDFTLYIMPNCIINMPISLGLQKNSPIKSVIDRFLRRVTEAGLVKKWLNDVMLDTVILEAQQQIEEVKALMDLKKLYVAFVVLISGYIFSILVFLFEIGYWYGVIKKNPLFDEYSLNCYYTHKKY